MERLLPYQGGERIPVRYIQDIRITVRSLPATPFSIFNCFQRKWNFLYKTILKKYPHENYFHHFSFILSTPIVDEGGKEGHLHGGSKDDHQNYLLEVKL